MLVNIVLEFTACNREQANSHCFECKRRAEQSIKPFVESHQKIRFILPAFPAKSANRNKTLSSKPDLGEKLALQKLNDFIATINTVHKPGCELLICSDGHVFNDLVMVKDEEVDNYQQMLMEMAANDSLENIKFVNLNTFYPNLTIQQQRESLLNDFAQSIDEIKRNIKTNQDEMLTFNGLHRFLTEDIEYFLIGESKNKLKKVAKDLTYQTIQRSHAWSNLLSHHYKNTIRLSIHPHLCTSSKIPIKFNEHSSRWATPWHNVVLKTKNGYQLIKRKQAVKMGAILKFINTDEAHYAL